MAVWDGQKEPWGFDARLIVRRGYRERPPNIGMKVRPLGEEIMTTVPQTTPMRLARRSGSTKWALPSAGMTVSTGGPGPGFQMTGGDVWRVIRANLWLIILLLIVSSVAGWYVNGLLEKQYTSTAYLSIEPKQ